MKQVLLQQAALFVPQYDPFERQLEDDEEVVDELEEVVVEEELVEEFAILHAVMQLIESLYVGPLAVRPAVHAVPV